MVVTASADKGSEWDCRVIYNRFCPIFGRKAMTNLDSIVKSRNITLSTKVCIVKVMIVPVVIYECETWTIRRLAQRICAFELWCLRRLLRVPWTTRRSNQSILKEISPEYSLEGLDKAEAPILGHLMRRAYLLEKTLMPGQEEKGTTEDEVVGWHHWLNGHECEQTLGDGEGREAWSAAVHGVAKSRPWLSDWIIWCTYKMY